MVATETMMKTDTQLGLCDLLHKMNANHTTLYLHLWYEYKQNHLA